MQNTFLKIPIRNIFNYFKGWVSSVPLAPYLHLIIALLCISFILGRNHHFQGLNMLKVAWGRRNSAARKENITKKKIWKGDNKERNKYPFYYLPDPRTHLFCGNANSKKGKRNEWNERQTSRKKNMKSERFAPFSIACLRSWFFVTIFFKVP